MVKPESFHCRIYFILCSLSMWCECGLFDSWFPSNNCNLVPLQVGFLFLLLYTSSFMKDVVQSLFLLFSLTVNVFQSLSYVNYTNHLLLFINQQISSTFTWSYYVYRTWTVRHNPEYDELLLVCLTPTSTCKCFVNSWDIDFIEYLLYWSFCRVLERIQL